MDDAALVLQTTRLVALPVTLMNEYTTTGTEMLDETLVSVDATWPSTGELQGDMLKPTAIARTGNDVGQVRDGVVQDVLNTTRPSERQGDTPKLAVFARTGDSVSDAREPVVVPRPSGEVGQDVLEGHTLQPAIVVRPGDGETSRAAMERVVVTRPGALPDVQREEALQPTTDVRPGNGVLMDSNPSCNNVLHDYMVQDLDDSRP